MTVAINSAAATTDLQITTAGQVGVLMGWSVTETAGAVATAVIRNGSGTGDLPVGYIGLAAAGSQTVWFGPQGVVCNNGIFLDRVTGTTQVVVYVK